MCRNRPEATRNGISSETPYRLCGGGQIVTMDDKAHYIDAWDLLIAHPPCTYLSNAGARHLWKGHQLQEDRVMKGILGRDLFMRFWWADIPRICVENPVPSRVFCLPEYTQIIQPYQFGHPYSKKTCLWLKNLDPVAPTNIVEPIATWCPSGSYSHKHDEKKQGDVYERQSAKSRKDIPGSRSSICRAIWRTVMKPINAEETVRVFNGWLEEADSLAEREAIERCIDHIQDAPAVSQQELRSYMLPWFSPFAAPWCGKIQRAFPKAYVTMNFELILVPRTNTYINLNHCSTPDEFKAEVIEGVSRFAFKAFTKPLCKEHLDGINKLLDTKFTPEDMEYIYTNLGNGINHELCMKFVKSGYDLKVIEESV